MNGYKRLDTKTIQGHMCQFLTTRKWKIKGEGWRSWHMTTDLQSSPYLYYRNYVSWELEVDHLLLTLTNYVNVNACIQLQRSTYHSITAVEFLSLWACSPASTSCTAVKTAHLKCQSFYKYQTCLLQRKELGVPVNASCVCHSCQVKSCHSCRAQQSILCHYGGQKTG